MVAKHRDKVSLKAALDQHIPDVMTELVAKMTEKGSMRLIQVDAKLLTFNVVCFLNIDGDDTVVMSGAYFLANTDVAAPPVWNQVSLKFKCQRGEYTILLIAVGKSEDFQVVKSSSLSGFQPIPLLPVSSDPQVRNNSIESAAIAEYQR